MSLFAIGTFLAFITAANSAVTSTVIAPAISQQSDDWLNSMRGESANFEKQIVKKQISTLVNHQRQKVIKKMDFEVQKQTSKNLEKIKDSPEAVRAWNKNKSVLEKSIQKIKTNINGIELKFDDKMLVSPELFPEKIGSQIMGDAPLNKSRESYTQEMLSLEAQEIIEKEKKDTLDEIDKRLKEDGQHGASKYTRSFLKIYRHDPDFMESQIEQIEQLSPGFKNSFKNLLFAKQELSKEDDRKIKDGLRIFRESRGAVLDNSPRHFSDDEIIAHIDEKNRIYELQLENLYVNYPHFAELRRKVKYQQKLMIINQELLENEQDLINFLEQYQEDNIEDLQIISRKKRDLRKKISGFLRARALKTLKNFNPLETAVESAESLVDLLDHIINQKKSLAAEIRDTTAEIDSLEQEMVTKHPEEQESLNLKIEELKIKKFWQNLDFTFTAISMFVDLCEKLLQVFSFIMLLWIGKVATWALMLSIYVAVFAAIIAAAAFIYYVASDDPDVNVASDEPKARWDLSFVFPNIQLI